METRTAWVVAICVIGAVVDVLAAIQMLVPALFGLTSGLNHFSPGSDYVYAMGMGASLMLGWTILLIWVARRPVERSGVLLITLCPVILGMAINEIRAVRDGFLPLAAVAPMWLGQTILASLCLCGYRSVARSQPSPAMPRA